MSSKADSSTATVVKKFFNDFFSQSGIHGFFYFSNQFMLHFIERFLWFALILFSLYFCVEFSLESWDRYLHKSTVVTIERDHYYWNTSLPSITICPMERLSRKLFDDYCE
jgi:amiloride-sensitive sodium channel